MNFARALLAAGLLVAGPAWAVYAPLPENNLNKDLVVALRTGVQHDSNIFGAQTGAIASTVWQASPSLDYSGSLNDQTYAAFNYTLTLDHFENRPGKKTLDSHGLMGRLARALGPGSSIDLTDQYQIAKNPESLLAGLPINTNQSYKRNELDARWVAAPAPRFAATLKFRSINYSYDAAALAAGIDRNENLYGLAGSYSVVPELKAVLEVRHEDVNYRAGGTTKDKRSDFAMAGFDYAVAKKLSVSGRLGGQWRARAAERHTTNPYAEFSAKYGFAERSFLSAGYAYTFEETSNVALYTDTRVHRMFVNVQHALSALIIGSASLTYEPSQLQGRRGLHANADETTLRAGVAVTWQPTTHWAVSTTFDHDKITSDDPGRGQQRDRYGVSVGYTF